MKLEEQIAWAQAYREKKSQATYLIPSLSVDVHKESYRFKNIRAIVHTPKSLIDEVLPIFINMHGGGFVKGSPEHDKVWCSVIAQRARCKVVNISYPLAPEYKFPLAIHAVYEFVADLYKNHKQWRINPNQIAIGGHSAGGNRQQQFVYIT